MVEGLPAQLGLTANNEIFYSLIPKFSENKKQTRG